MMKHAIAMMLAGSAALAAMPAAAQQARPFEGVYVGISGGYQILRDDDAGTVTFDRGNNGTFGEQVTTASGANAFSPGFCGGEANGVTPAAGCGEDDGAIDFGARLGFDLRPGSNLLIGALGEFTTSNLRDHVSAFSTTPASYQFTRKVDYTLALRGRAGVVSGPVLIYGTGGVAWAQMDNRFITSNTANSFTQNNAERRVRGWQAGGGVEVAVSRGATLGLEYLYNDFNDEDYSVTVGQGTAPATNPFVLAGGVTMRPEDTSLDWHGVRATLGFRF